MWHKEIKELNRKIMKINDGYIEDVNEVEIATKLADLFLEYKNDVPVTFAHSMRRCKTQKGIDGVLNRLYNWADASRVWLGF